MIEVLAVLDACRLHRPAELRALSVHAPDRSPDATSRMQRRQRLDRLLRWVQANLAEELRVSDAAEIVGISPAAFGRHFQREVGKGFIDFVNDARCSWAALRLLQGQEPIADIAHGCGFPTLSNFGEQFRRRYGASPRDYRRHALRR